MSTSTEQALHTRLKEALVALNKMRTKLEALEQARSEPIAVIGIGCRFPGGAHDPESFWQLLHNGVDAIGEVPPDRWDVDEYYDPDPDAPGKMSSRWGGFLADVDRFDAGFFGISPREALTMDPQQRLLLEVAWEALEHAGQAPDRLAGSKTGVFVGITVNDYLLLQSGASSLSTIDAYRITGNSLNSAAGRLAYTLGLHGPAMAVDTACSSSLVAVHLACQSLRSGESSMALAGGVNLILSPEMTIGATKARMMAADGRCKTFDARADGFVRSEGCGVVVLKRLSDALAAGDTVLAVIRGTAVNQDGFSSGLTVPNKHAQEAVIRQALANAGVEPAQVSYVEAHGTGTALGDPIEVRALAAVLGQGRSPDSPFMVGSVKTNIGHAESAAGIAALIKAVLALQHQEIPPHLHFETPTPNIAWDEVPAVVPVQRTPWTDSERIAGVSSFGASGTNAHVIVSQAPVPVQGTAAEEVERPWHLLALSAKQESALRELALRYQAYLAGEPQASLADICYTANGGRAHFEERLAVVGETAGQMAALLAGYAAGAAPAELGEGLVVGSASDVRPPLAFLFSGHGAQYAGMGQALYAGSPPFRQVVDTCEELLRSELALPLRQVWFEGAGGEAVWAGMAYTQPVLFVLEMALAEVWRSWGIRPDVVLGHSVGEYAAACVAGVMSLADGLKLVATRGRLMEQLAAQGVAGEMVALFAPVEAVAAWVAPYAEQVALAVVNGPSNTVISGASEPMAQLLAQLEAQGVKWRRLAVGQASHSPLLEPILDEFEQVARQVAYQPPQLALVSNVSGQVWAGGEGPDAGYWRRHLRQTVQFAAGVEQVVARGCRCFVELGPAPTLLGMARRCLAEEVSEEVAWLPSLRPGREEWEVMLASLAALQVAGVAVDWRGFDAPYTRRRVALPSYPFQRQRYWLRRPGRAAAVRRGGHALLGSRLRSAGQEGVYEAWLCADQPGYLGEHRVGEQVVVAGALYLELALAAGQRELQGAGQGVGVGLEEVVFERPLVLPAPDTEGASGVTVQVVVRPEGAGSARFAVYSLAGGEEAGAEGEAVGWARHAAGRVVRLEGPEARAGEGELAAVQGRCGQGMLPAAYYARLAQHGLHYGPAFQGLVEIGLDPAHEHLLGRAALPDGLQTAGYIFHPALLDACLQVLGVALPDHQEGQGSYLPLSVDHLALYRPPTGPLWSYVTNISPRLGAADGPHDVVAGDVLILDEQGEVVAEVKGFTLKQVAPDALGSQPEWLYEVTWQTLPPPQATGSVSPTAAQPGLWLLFADEGGFAQELAARLKAQGEHPVLVHQGAGYGRLGANQFRLDPAQPEQFRCLLDDLAGDAAALGQIPVAGIVHLWSLDHASWYSAQFSAGQLADAQQALCGSVLHLVQALAAREETTTPSLWLVTRGAQAAGADDPALPGLTQATLWGLGKVIAQEHPELRCVRVDLDASGSTDELDGLLDILRTDDGEDQIALRRNQRLVPRLVPGRSAARSEQGRAKRQVREPVQLAVSSRGTLESLEYRPLARRSPGPGEVEIEVHATGLGFRDVLNVLGMVAQDTGPLGGECAGRVVAVGAGVDSFQVGDEVIAMALGSFKSFITLPADFVARKPAPLTLVEAATIPSAFLTAYYTLHRLAGMSAGGRVLIHAAAGGVGLAAVALAQRAGAEIFATAGSPAKRALLRSLGVQHVMDSRSLAFADEIMAITQGEGVDIVLNSLADDFIPKSLSVLAEQGRFLEIGKRGVWSPEQVAQVKPRAYYAVADLVTLAEREPALIKSMLGELVAAFDDGTLTPLPLQVVPWHRAAHAFRTMAQARHMGKIVVTHPPQRPADARLAIHDQGSYLITGGLGGLGLAAAEWLVERGARHLVLVGRSAPSEEARAHLQKLAEAGAQVVVAQADVAQAAELGRVLAEIDRHGPPLRGVIHAAGVLDDGVLLQQSWPRFAKVFRPKVEGSWNLHLLTRERPLDFFVLFSSAVALLGSAGQANHVAANTFLDALAQYRHSQGLPALSINWGPWAEIGAAASKEVQQHVAQRGVRMIAPREGVRWLEQMLARAADHPDSEELSQVGAVAVDWSRFRYSPTSTALPPFFGEVIARSRSGSTGHEQKPGQSTNGAGRPDDLLRRLAETPPDQQVALLSGFVREQSLKVLGLDPSYPLDRRKPLRELGLDSLMAVELRNRLGAGLAHAHKLPPTLVFDYPTVETLTGYLAEKVLGSAPAPAAVQQEPPSSLHDQAKRVGVAELENISDEDAEALLLAKLELLAKGK